MGQVVVINHVTLDGVMQGPGRPDEDTRDGFEAGGWALDGNDDAMGAKMGELMGGDHAWLFGRRLFDRGVPTRLELIDSATTGTGVVIATYQPVRP